MNSPKKSNNIFDSSSTKICPLMVGCSGGGGHIAAIKGLYDYLQESYGEDINLPDHTPTPRQYFVDNGTAPKARQLIDQGVTWMHEKGYTSIIVQTFISMMTKYPMLPQRHVLEQEISMLESKNPTDVPRPYVDMLLDAYPAGYESAAIWNVLQRADETEMLKRLLKLQKRSDEENYEAVKQRFLEILIDAREREQPFTEVVSTQAMCLAGMADAVKQYNEQYGESIEIHQYLTDLPTKGAIHYFKSLNALSPEQQKVIKLYGRGLTTSICKEHIPGQQFKATHDIPPTQNPMVRSGFKNEATSLHDKWEQTNDMTYLDYELNDNGVLTKKSNKSHRQINHGDKVASIMLGSQASNDTFRYVKALLDNGHDHIFVFGGLHSNISNELENIINSYPQTKQESIRNKIVRLGNQSDREMQPIMSRSNTVIIRGGGLSVMEQMTMKHHPKQMIFIHHADTQKKELSSGISWEDENVNNLISFLKDPKNGEIFAKKTSPSRIQNDLIEGDFKRIQKTHYRDSKTINENAFIGRMKIITEKLGPSFVSQKEDLLFKNLETVNALSKLAAAGPLNQALTLTVANDAALTTKINTLSLSFNRVIGFIYASISSDCDVSYSFKNPESAVQNLYAFYHYIERGHAKNTLKADELSQIKTAMFSKITEQYPLPMMDRLINQLRSGVVRNRVKLGFLEYRLNNIPDVQNNQDPHYNHSEPRDKAILKGIKSIIETTSFDTGILGLGLLGGDTIQVTGKNETNKVPHHIALIHSNIVTAENNGNYSNSLKDIEQIIDNKVQKKNFRPEYRALKNFLQSYKQAQKDKDIEPPQNKGP